MSRKKYNLTEEQMKELEEFIKNPPSDRIGLRASMILDCARGMTGDAVARKYAERPNTVSNWKRRYTEYGIPGLMNRSRGRTKDGYGKDFPELLRQTVSGPPPEGSQAWDVPLLAKRLQVPEYGIKRHLEKLGISLKSQAVFQERQIEEPSVAPEGSVEVDSDSHMLNVSLSIAAIDETGNTFMVRTADLGRILADPEHFDVSTVLGFHRDYGRLEQEIIKGFAVLLQQFSSDYVIEVDKRESESK